MDQDIVNFLPKYPNITKIDEEFFNPYDEDFSKIIFNKKEFYDYRLDKNEDYPQNIGDLMKSQILIKRFFSSHTLYDELLLFHEMGCVAPETPILKWDGSVVRADEVTEGDILIGDDGTPRKVMSLIQGKSEMYKIEQQKADSYIVNSNHILTLTISENYSITWTENIQTWTLNWFDKKELKPRAKTIKCSNITKEEGYENMINYRDFICKDNDNTLDITVKDYLNLSKSVKTYLKGYKCTGINWKSSPVKIDPYIMGMWLGYGFIDNDTEYLKKWAQENNYIIKTDILQQYNIKDNKHIPREYIINDRDTRLKVLAGLIDTNGYVHKDGTCVEIIQKNKTLANDICYLIRSLGYSCNMKEYTKCYIISFSGNNLQEIPTIIPDKKINTGKQVKETLLTEINVISVGKGNYVGWELEADSNKRFLLGDFTVTHNTGKTCSAIGAIEQIRSEGGGFRGAFYLAKGDALINNFINELIFKCTDGRYIPEEYDKLTELEKAHRRRKSISDYYITDTFETFAKEISKLTDDILRKRYNNYVIVIDEVHNLRLQKKESDTNIYQQFWRFLHVVQDCKILLMSGTPMKDNVDEIASVMNLILPIEKQLPTGEEFLEKFFIKVREDQYKIIAKNIKFLKKLFKGKISYLKAMQSEIPKKFNGSTQGNLQYFNVVNDYMSEFQTKSYNAAYQLDQEDRKGVYANSRQAALFVYPDSTYGKIGFETYIVKSKYGSAVGKTKSNYMFSLNNELRSLIKDTTPEKMLIKLSKYSSKYAQSIKNILESNKQNKSVFLYNEFVGGSGLILFSLILELFGYSKASGYEEPDSKRLRYSIITSETASTNKIRTLVDRFNKPDNMYGEIIGVILGSKKIAEGFSLQNIQVEEIQTPWFNYSEIAQAIARGYRLGSHRALLNEGLSPELTVYQRISIPNDDTTSIDLYMYEISERKDISIKGVERIIKESAWDCALTYKRNNIIGYDGQRECDYMKCNYNCDNFQLNDFSDKDIDYSTYQLYYSESNINDIIEIIIDIFKTKFKMDFYSIVEKLPGYTIFEIVTALRTMITNSTKIINKYGFPSYIQEKNNIFFLIDNLSVIGKISSEYYTEFPNINDSLNYNQILEPMYNKSLPIIVSEACRKVKNEDNLRKYIKRLPKEIHEYLIESSILAQQKNINTSVVFRNLVLKYFKNYYEHINNQWICWYLQEDNDVIRCLEDDIWVNCKKDIRVKIDDKKRDVQKNMETNPYGYYGQYNNNNNKFCIREVKDPTEQNKAKRTAGRVCSTWKRDELIKIALFSLKAKIPDKMDHFETKNMMKEINEYNRDKLIYEIMSNRYLKLLYIQDNINIKEENELRRILFWGTLKNKHLCYYLQKWFETNSLLVQDNGCGVQGRPKI